ncbi:MAG: uracil-DNA glycosylase, partial [Candidatus Margulisiibacteriota bacterium]
MIDFNKKTNFDHLTHDQLQLEAEKCQSCPLHEHRTQVVFHSGNHQANLMFVGEGPGQQEDEEGLPFVGRSGQLLTKILESVEIHRDDIYIANTVKCRPPKNRTPHAEEMAACEDYLIRQIQLVQPKIICLLGSAAVKAILGPTESISK